MKANHVWRPCLLLVAISLAFVTTRGPKSVSAERAAGDDTADTVKPLAQGHCITAPSGLISWWPGDGNANDIQDGNTGTLFNTTFVQGEVDQAFNFASATGTTTGVSIGNPGNLQLNSNLTIDFWVKRSGATKVSNYQNGAGACLFCYGTGGYAVGMFGDGTIGFAKQDASIVSSSLKITDTAFHHVAVTKAGSAVTLYLDGTAANVGPYDPGFVFNTDLGIGARGDDGTAGFLGVMDEVDVFNRALSAGEIQSIFSQGGGGKCKLPASQTIQFSDPNYNGNEGCAAATITVTRSGDTSGTATVDFATNDGSAQQTTDYSIASGTLTFAPGVTSQTFSVLLTADAYAEGNETVGLALSNATGGAVLGTPTIARVTIIDDTSVPTNSQPIDTTATFVCQHYHDFLSREPDPGGAAYWTSQITQCGADATCIHNKRIDVSNAFFFELEYQQTAAYVFRLYRGAFGNNQPFPNSDAANTNLSDSLRAEARKIPGYAVCSLVRARLIGSANLAQDQLALANLFVQRPEFLSKYPASLTLDQFVDALLATINSDDGVDLTSQRAALINLGSRGAVIYRLCDDNAQTNPINNRAFIDAEYNRSFVASQYFGYFRRDADIKGFLFWMDQVNSAPLRDVQRQHALVCSQITSPEYQNRFSSVVTHFNPECGP